MSTTLLTRVTKTQDRTDLPRHLVGILGKLGGGYRIAKFES